MKRDTRAIREHAQRCATVFRFSLFRKDWAGASGSLAGLGAGSSLEFQDHRPYLPGDDPRHIDWAATARSDQAVMKVYREEVSPRIDLVLDLSASMAVTSAKEIQTLRLFFFCMESARELSATLRLFMVSADGFDLIPAARAFAKEWEPPEFQSAPSRVDPHVLPLRPGSLRVVVSDLLYAVDPAPWLRSLLRDRGRACVLAPFDASEEEPDWSGHMELLCCETGESRRQRISSSVRSRYRTAYRRHLNSWRDEARTAGIGFARVPSTPDLPTALHQEALPAGLFEPWG